ncbi:MAG: AAA family ATPase [Bacteroidales bacterium]|nr:AAA family ATPase [Bacteroidales bacterium]
MAGQDFLYSEFLSRFGYEPTECQRGMFRTLADFIAGADADIMVIDGHAGTGKTSAIAAAVQTLDSLNIATVLLAPTGRAAKVLSGYAGRNAQTIHKHIYRQKTFSGDGFGQFDLGMNKARDAVFFVDEASLIGIDSGQQNPSLFGSGNLLGDLVQFVRDGLDCKLVLLGDSAQLPPVGLDCSPTLSREFMSGFGGVMFSHLTTVVRQQKESGILHNATLLRELIENPEAWDGGGRLRFRLDGFDDVERVSGAELIDALSDAYAHFGEEETIVLCRSNRRANRYNAGIRSMVQYKEERLVRDDSLMIVKNCYKFVDEVEGMDFIANGDMARLVKISHYEDRYGLHFATARLSLPDYDGQEIVAKVVLDTLESESPSLTYEQQNMLYAGVDADYADVRPKKRRYEKVREDEYFNALQLKYANAVTGHKAQGGQWKCVFIDNPLWAEEVTIDELKWLYTALTRAMEKVYFVSFRDVYFEG